jgi:hypothetical protein
MSNSTSTSTVPLAIRVITAKDRVVIQGRYFVYEDEQHPLRRFRMRGMAFPVPLHYKDKNYPYDAKGWIAVLKQLREASPYLNTLRLYRLPPLLADDGQLDFFQSAADLGFYLLIPLTDVSGHGVLDRDLVAPKCYPRRLYSYGIQVLDALQHYPNILAGVIGNEVMNSLQHWHSAPCLLAYARDLKLHMMKSSLPSNSGSAIATKSRPYIPLVYTAQHDGIGAMVSPAELVQLTTNYLTCTDTMDDNGIAIRHDDDDNNNNNNNNNNSTSTVASLRHAIDAIGINIESWCSSLQSFDRNEDGSMGTFLDLFQHLENNTSPVPIFFSELGCSQFLFDRDNGMRQSRNTSMSNPVLGARTWNELVIVEHEMQDVWSGYVAYTYDGPTGFRMAEGGPWDGINTLTFNADMESFLQQLATVASSSDNESIIVGATNVANESVSCSLVQNALTDCCNLDLTELKSMPSYARPSVFTKLKSWFEQFLPGFRKIDGSWQSRSTVATTSMTRTKNESMTAHFLKGLPMLELWCLIGTLILLTSRMRVWSPIRPRNTTAESRRIRSSHIQNYNTFHEGGAAKTD